MSFMNRSGLLLGAFFGRLENSVLRFQGRSRALGLLSHRSALAEQPKMLNSAESAGRADLAKRTHSSLFNLFSCLFFWFIMSWAQVQERSLSDIAAWCWAPCFSVIFCRISLITFILHAQIPTSLIMEYTLDVNTDKWTSQCPATEA